MTTDVEKKMMINRLLTAWMCNKPTLRLGQLIANAVGDMNTKDLFYITDSNLIEKTERYIRRLDIQRKK